VFGDPLFRFGERTRNVNHDDLPATGANDVVVVLRGIVEFVIAAGTLEIDLVHKVQSVEQSDHTKHSGIIGPTSFGRCQFLDLLKGKRFFRPEENVQNIAPAGRNAHPFASQPVQNGFGRKRIRFTHEESLRQLAPHLNREASQPNGNSPLREEFLCLGDAVGAEVKNTGS
jgi:hypothetical protein